MLSERHGCGKNEENAVVWYKKAAEQGNAEAQCALGECYYQARGVEKDDKEARRWYEAAATQGNVTARYMTGRLYAALSYNVAAVKWYTKAAEQECPEAQYELGVCYEAGDGVGKDEAKAAELYRKAAGQSYAEAQKNWVTAILMAQVSQKTWSRHLNATARRQNRAMQERRTIWAFAIRMEKV